MTDLDNLERLVRLRDNGGLTEEEFLAEKVKLLAVAPPSETKSENTPSWVLFGGASAIALAMIVAVVAMLQRQSPLEPQNSALTNVVVPADDQASAGAAAHTVENSPPASLKEGSYAWATSIFRVGENPAYIEKVLGPAQQKDSASLFYNMKDCPVQYMTKNGKVIGIHIAVLNNCRPEINGRVITPQMKFDSVYSERGFLQTSCLMDCGNKADPTVEYVVPGPHSDNFIGVRYSTYDGDEGITIWGSEIAKAKGVASDSDVPFGGFYCPPKPSQAVVNAMKNATISSVTIGVDVEKCDEW